MSIINDALKKAEKDKQFSQNKPAQLLCKLDGLRTDTKRFVLKRWLIFAGAGAVCFLGVLLAVNSFKSPADSPPVLETAAKIEASQRLFPPKETDAITPLNLSGFRLSGILYDEQKPLAIINERVVGKGALVKGARLLEIQPNYVRLSLEGKEFKLKVK
ncbi:MAG: general secretion pathway protein GspB [Candidatus Omnitrophica bacterium]|nr:general secretion pathway protein GspB [Candidatus Omnitrophota bacterium]